LGLAPAINAAGLLILAVLVVVPLRYVHPSRTEVCRPLTVALGAVWACLAMLMVWELPDVTRPVLWLSLIFPIYYVALSLALNRSGRSTIGRTIQ
jgi:phosphatidylcholine synthase